MNLQNNIPALKFLGIFPITIQSGMKTVTIKNGKEWYEHISPERNNAVKINDSLKKAPTQGADVKESKATSANAAGTGAAKEAQTANTGGTASVNVNLSSQLQAVMEQLAETNVFDTQKVNEIKAAIAGGQFQVDSGKVADGLINTTKGLLQQQPRE